MMAFIFFNKLSQSLAKNEKWIPMRGLKAIIKMPRMHLSNFSFRPSSRLWFKFSSACALNFFPKFFLSLKYLFAILSTLLFIPLCTHASRSIVDAALPLPAPIFSMATKDKLFYEFKKINPPPGETAIRLILAESMAAHCEVFEEGDSETIKWVMAGIAKVIFNRMRGKPENELRVVFAKNQFNSSLARYSCSELEGFLDPNKFKLRIKNLTAQDLWIFAVEAWRGASSNRPTNIFEKEENRVENYYLFEHGRQGSCHFKPPAWAQEKKKVPLSFLNSKGELTENQKSKIDACIKFYHLN